MRANDESDDVSIEVRTVLIGFVLLNIAGWAFYGVAGMVAPVLARAFG